MESFDPSETWDTLNSPSPPHLHWSTDNVGEAAPGVLTPLGWSLWGTISERATRRSFHAIGALSAREARFPDRPEARVVNIFYGRLALQIELLTLLGDRLPGTSGQEIAASLFGTIPDDIEFGPTRRRYPVIAVRLPLTFLRLPGRIRAETPEFDRWWRAAVEELPHAGLERSRALLGDACRTFEEALLLQTMSVIGLVQPLFDALTRLVGRAGRGDVGVLSGSGGAEMAVIGDIWEASRGRMTLEEVVRNHGFHGPHEGEISSRVWREDPAPLERLVREYAQRDESHAPGRGEAEAKARMREMQREVIAALPRSRRPAARLLLALAAERIPLRGVAKRSFLQAIDVARGSARRIGAHLAERGTIDDPDDVFYLLLEDLLGRPPDDAKALVALRQERRAEYERLVIPGSWKGVPTPLEAAADEDGAGDTYIRGVGVSAGVVEGPARVVTDPAFVEVEPDEILVAPTTDPSWSSIMFISAGLVVDIGGPMSHAAVVARELGLPCVVNTRTGTRRIKTGDRVRVDGDQGVVEVLATGSAEETGRVTSAGG